MRLDEFLEQRVGVSSSSWNFFALLGDLAEHADRPRLNSGRRSSPWKSTSCILQQAVKVRHCATTPTRAMIATARRTILSATQAIM